MVLTSDIGMELTDADQIKFDNVQLITKTTKPVIFTENATNISFSGIKYNKNSDVLISVNGERSKDLKMEKTDVSSAQKATEFAKGASDKSLLVKTGK